jgi:hypothetical protein
VIFAVKQLHRDVYIIVLKNEYNLRAGRSPQMSVTRTVPHARWREYRSNTKADQSMERVGAVITQPVSHSHVVPRHSPWNEQSCEHAVSTAGPATAAPGVKTFPAQVRAPAA